MFSSIYDVFSSTTIEDNEGQSLVGDVSHVTAIDDDEIEDNSYNDYNHLQLFHAGVRPNGQTTETTFVAHSAQGLTRWVDKNRDKPQMGF